MSQYNQKLNAVMIYAAILGVAIFLGYILASPLSYSGLIAIGLLFLLLVTPLVLRWHHPLLLLSWNMTAVVPFVPGRLQLWLLMACVSLAISILQYTLNRKLVIVRGSSIIRPLLFIGAMMLVTAFMTGGIGMRVFGAESVGGRKYLVMMGAIIGYFAMAAWTIPGNRANLFCGLFILGALTNAIGNLLPYVPHALYPIFTIFPVEHQGVTTVLQQESVVVRESISRFLGLSIALMALSYFLLARNGLNRLLDPRKPSFWLFGFSFCLSTLGGFRSLLILLLLTVALVFLLEGVYRSAKFPVILLAGMLGFAGVVAFVDKMPISIQRSLSFLPIAIDPMVRADAEGSADWRLEMWRDLLPEIPRHLLLGKGLSISRVDLESADNLARQGYGRTAEVAMLAGDYHSGPLSVVIPFGIWGVVGWIWFISAGIRALYLNYRYSPGDLKSINTFLFAYFLAKLVLFHLIFGAFEADLIIFSGILGFSISLNDGIRKPVPAANHSKRSIQEPWSRPRLTPGFPSSPRGH